MYMSHKSEVSVGE